MKKIINITILILCLIILINNNINIVKAKYNSDYSTENYVNDGGIYLEKFQYNEEDEIEIVIILELVNEIVGYDYDSNGFDLISAVNITDDKIYFSIEYDNLETDPIMKFQIYLDNEEILTYNLWGYAIEEQLFINQYSKEKAYNIYLNYLKNTNYEKYFQIKNKNRVNSEVNIENHNDNNIIMYENNVITSTNFDTCIYGTLQWKDDKEENHFLQYCLVEIYDIDPIGETWLGSTYTDQFGYYEFNFENQDGLFEHGGYDISVRVFAEGKAVATYDEIGIEYVKEIEYFEDISTGTVVECSKIFEMEADSSYFGKALQITQAAIFASKYYSVMENINLEQINDVTIVYPNIDEDKKDCYYSGYYETIYICDVAKNEERELPASYASWDVIMHEYGHHVEHEVDMNHSPSFSHWVNVMMGDHYMAHFKGDSECNDECAYNKNRIANEAYCEYLGLAISWNEGWATYFSMVSQEYYASQLPNIFTVNDQKYTAYNNVDDEIEIGLISDKGFDCENVVTKILYDMYDVNVISSENTFDSLSLGHQKMWDLTLSSEFITFSDFENYFKTNHTVKSDFELYGKLLGYYGVAPLIEDVELISYFSPDFDGYYLENSVYFMNKMFRINFYDSNRNFICQTDLKTTVDIHVSDETWSSVLNANGSTFFASLEVVSQMLKTDDTSYTSCFEGEWMELEKPQPTIIEYTSRPTEYITNGNYYWYKFIVPQTNTYTFETTGNCDTYGELFYTIAAGRSTIGMLPNGGNDDGGEDSNFKINYYLQKGEVVYIKVRGYDEDCSGTYTLSIYCGNHIHDYSYSCSSVNNLCHNGYCFCGDSRLENHSFIEYGIGFKCNGCGYFTTGPIISEYSLR